MTAQAISIDGRWRVVVLYDVQPGDIRDVAQLMSLMGADTADIRDAADNLSGWNAGMTYTSFPQQTSLVCIGRADSLREFLNTVSHETDHVQAHVAEYYGVTLGTEQAAYLQGYIGGRLFEFVISEIAKTLFW